MDFWLIQRCKFKNEYGCNPTFDQFVTMDYMGSTEFEIGNQHQSLVRLKAKVKDLVLTPVPTVVNLKDKKLWVLTYKTGEDLKAICEFTYLDSQTRVILKEWTGLHHYVTPGEEWAISRYDLWWDIQNDFFYSFDRRKLEQLVGVIGRSLKGK